MRCRPVVILTLFCWLCGLPTGSAGPRAAAPQKYSVKGGYRVGERLALRRRITLEVVRNDQPIIDRGGTRVRGKPYHYELKATATFDIDIVVAAGKRKGEKKITMTFRRIRAKAGGSEGTKEIDTDGPPATILQGDAPLLKHLSALKGISVVFETDPAGETAAIRGPEKYARRFARASFPSARPEERKRQVASFTRAFGKSFRLLLAEPFVYLPSKPVAVGGSWRLHRDLTQHELWGTPGWYVKENVKCRLASVKATPAGRVATIELSGTWTVGPPYRPVETALAKRGQVKLNIDTGRLVAHHVEVQGSLPIHNVLSLGDPDVHTPGKLPRTGTEDFKFVVDLELRPAGKRPKRPATTKPAPARQPSE